MSTPGSPAHDAEIACDFVATRVERSVGRVFRQGFRKPPLVCRSSAAKVRLFAEERLYRVPVLAASALVAWADGFPVELLRTIPDPLHVLALQAEGRRCVSLLADGSPTAPHADVLDFALHDLCHLAKFIDPEHYVGQVGFSDFVLAAIRRPEWTAFVELLDATFIADLHHVIADMNGSAIFLFSALKMKLKMGARRRYARLTGEALRESGALTPGEAAMYADLFDQLVRLFDLDARLNDAARLVSTRRDHPEAARALLCFFRDHGARNLERRWGSALGPMFDVTRSPTWDPRRNDERVER